MRTTNLFLILVFASLLFMACKREEFTAPALPETISHFTNKTSGLFFVQNTPNAVYKIPIGLTTPSDKETKVTVSVSSPTGAASGAQYSLPSNTIIIPAGQTLDSLTVRGIFSGFAGNRKDTLVFTITGGDVAAADYNKTYRLVMQQYCPVNLASFTGTYIAQDYDAATNLPDGTPYTLTLTPSTSTATSGTVAVSGLWGVPNSFNVVFDWASPSNFSTNIADQNWFIHAVYGQAKIKAAGMGVFSSCENTVTIRYEAYVSAGTFGTYYTTLRK